MRLINADALIEHLRKDPLFSFVERYGITGVIEAAPTIDPVKHGKWMPHPTKPDWDVCSACGTETHIRFHGYDNGAFWDSEESYTYCPHCGAKMDEVGQ